VAELIKKNITDDRGGKWDRLYKVGDSEVFIKYARQSIEENDKVLEEIKQVHIGILKNLASESVTS